MDIFADNPDIPDEPGAAYSAGYRAGLEAAAKACDAHPGYEPGRCNCVAAIRALAADPLKAA